MQCMIPLVSVVLPARNAARTLSAAVESIQQQTLTSWELLVVDNGSTDDTAALAGNLARLDPRVRLLRQPDGGIVAALHQGIAAARGEFLARMDADDCCHPERLLAQVSFLQEHPEVGVVGCLVDFGGDRAVSEGYARHVDWLNSLVTPEDIALNRFVESPFAHPSVTIRCEMFARHGGYREGPFPEDYELWLRWLEAGVRMAKVPRVLLTWSDPPDRLSRTDPRYSPEAFFRVKASYLAAAVAKTRSGRQVWIWGAGRPTRVRAEYLTLHGVCIHGYIDLDPRKDGRVIRGRRIVGLGSIPPPTEALVLGYVSKRGARELDRSHLLARGYREGLDFWMAA